MANERSLLLALGSYSPYVHQLFFHLFKDDQSLLHRAAMQLKMASVCQTCGDAGFDELLEYCKKCRSSAQHRYCFPELPETNEDVIWICELCESSLEKLDADSGRSKDVSFQQNRVACCSQRGMIEGESSQCISPEQDKGWKRKKRRRLILVDEGQFDHEAQSGGSDQDDANKIMKLPVEPVMALSPSCTDSCEVTVGSCVAAPEPSATLATIQEEAHNDQNLKQSARPIYKHVWSGHISLGDEKYGPLTAHLSTLACQRVYDASKSLPPLLHMEKMSRLESLPNSFKNSPPGDDKIGLFFLPKSTTAEPVVDQLLAEVIRKDLVLKCMLEEVELLMLPSTILPKENHKFQEKYYLWGAFRLRQAPADSSIADRRITPKDAKEENQRKDLFDKNTRDNGGGLGREESSPDGSDGGSFAFSPHSVLQHPKPNELCEETRKSEDLSKHAGEKDGVEDCDEETQEQEEGEILDKHEKGEEMDIDRNERKVYEDYNDGHILLSFPPASENMSIASEVGGRQNMEVESQKENPRELEEGEILNEFGQQEAMQCPKDPDELKCLPLFTLFSEDLGVAGGIENHHKLNLDLGLWCRSSGNDGSRSAGSIGFPSSSL